MTSRLGSLETSGTMKVFPWGRQLILAEIVCYVSFAWNYLAGIVHCVSFAWNT